MKLRPRAHVRGLDMGEMESLNRERIVDLLAPLDRALEAKKSIPNLARSTISVMPKSITPPPPTVWGTGDVSLADWLAQTPRAIRQELGYGGCQTPGRPRPLQTPGQKPEEPLAHYVRRVMRDWGHPFPQSDHATPGRYLSTMVRANTVVERDPDGSSLIIEFLWSIRRDVLIAFSFQEALVNGTLGDDTAIDLARRLQVNYKAADTLGALDKLVPEWEKAAMLRIMKRRYPIPLGGLDPCAEPCNRELRERVANLLTELMWLVRRINALVKHDERMAAVKYLPRAIQVRAGIIHLGSAEYLPEWQDLYLDRALDALTDGVVSKAWPLFSKHD